MAAYPKESKREYRVRLKSGMMGTRHRLHARYMDFAEWQIYSRTYGLAQRLGYKNPRNAWDSNPVVEGGILPNDFRKVQD